MPASLRKKWRQMLSALQLRARGLRYWLVDRVLPPKVGVGIVTYNRPAYFCMVINAALAHFAPLADLYVYNDGSQPNDEYQRLFATLPSSVTIIDAQENRGVAVGKNALLSRMQHYDYIFLLEDDLIPCSPKGITEYIRARHNSGIEHFNFAHHGPANAGGPVRRTRSVEFYPSLVGAWSMYTGEALRRVGLMDENFHNAWEHVEHTHRLALAGLTSPFWQFADVVGSRLWFREIPDSLSTSTIRNNPAWRQQMMDGLVYWERKDPDRFPLRAMLKDLRRDRGREVR